jgi:hypothetical protein
MQIPKLPTATVKILQPVLTRHPNPREIIKNLAKNFYPVMDAILRNGFARRNPIADDVQITAAFGLEPENFARNTIPIEPM